MPRPRTSTNRFLRAAISLGICAVVGLPLLAAADAGDLDDSFSGNGSRSLAGNGVSGIAVQPNGRILAVSGKPGPGDDFDMLVMRLLPDGDLDRSFAGDGSRTIDFGGANDSASSVEVAEDGRIVVGGSTDGRIAVARLHPDGRLDGSWGAGGRTAVDVREGRIEELMVHPNGKVMVGGTGTKEGWDWLLIRFRNNGTLDSSFRGDGKAYLDWDSGPDSFDSLEGMDLATKGRIVGVGDVELGGVSHLGVARFLANGRLDETFQNAGLGEYNRDNPTRYVNGVNAAKQGIAIPGAQEPSPGESDYWVKLLGPGGNPDPDFGTNGEVAHGGARFEQWNDIRFHDGKIVAVGSSCLPSAPFTCVGTVGRYRMNGDLDTSFGNGGIAKLGRGASDFVHFREMSVKGDKVIAAGFVEDGNTAQNTSLIARFRLANP